MELAHFRQIKIPNPFLKGIRYFKFDGMGGCFFLVLDAYAMPEGAEQLNIEVYIKMQTHRKRKQFHGGWRRGTEVVPKYFEILLKEEKYV